MSIHSKRFFSFGCSFTKYRWPTWADLIGENFPLYFNYGRAGAGNFYIFNSLIEAGQRHSFQKDDTIIIQWSFVGREDRYINNKWVGMGCMVHGYPEDYIEKYFDFKGFLIRDLSLIKASKSYLESIGCRHIFISMLPINSVNNYNIDIDCNFNEILELYKDVLDEFRPSFIEILGDFSKRRPIKINNCLIDDDHPIPSEHFNYCQKILPEFKVNEDRPLYYDNFLATIYNNPRYHEHHDLLGHAWPISNPSQKILRF